MSQALAKVNKARQLLAEARTLEEVLTVSDLAAAAEFYAKKAKAGLEAQNDAAAIHLRAQRKAGEITRQLERGAPGPKGIASSGGHNSEYAAALEGVGATRQDAQRWETLASMPEDAFDNVINTTIEEGRELHTSTVLTAAKRTKTDPTPSPQVEPEELDISSPEYQRRLGEFERQVGVLVQTCEAMAGVVIPILTAEKGKELGKQIKDASKNVRTLKTNLEASCQA